MTGMLAAFIAAGAQQVATFEEVELPESLYYNGSDGTGGFSSGGFWFPVDYNADWMSWSGFSVSAMKDSITAGYGNQYSSIAGSGANGSEKYVVAYDAGALKLPFETAMEVKGFYITNTTYAYLAMRDGSDWTKKFGGTSGTEPDYFKLMVSGTDMQGNPTDTLEFYLADFRSENPEENYILKDWEWFNCESLGAVTALNFALESSDVGEYGMNTPAYFCIDNFTAALPSVSSPQVKKQTELRIYPNPAKNLFYIDVPDGTQRLSVTDGSGRILFMQESPRPESMPVRALEGMPAGVYFIRLKTNEGVVSAKMVKH